MSRFALGVVLLGVAVAAVAARFLWQPGLDSLYDDSVSYLLLAQWLSPWHAADPAIVAAAPLEKYPPLFPLVLALTDGAYDWRIAHLVVAAAFAATVVLLALHTARITRSGAVGLACAAAFALMPGSWLIAKGILTEYPYTALVLATLLWHGRLDERSPKRSDAAVLALLLACTVLTRTVGVALVGAVCAAEAMRYRSAHDRARARTMAAAVAASLVAIGAWYLVRPAGGHDQYAHSMDAVREGIASDGLNWLLVALASNAQAIGAAWMHAMLVFWGEASSPRFLIAAAVGVAGLAASVYRAASGRLDGLYVVAFLLLLLPWPYPGQMYRLAFPLAPLILAHALWALHAGLMRARSERTAARWTALAVVLPLASCVPAVVFYLAARAQTPDDSHAVPKTTIAEFYRIPSGPAAQENAWRQIDVMQDLKRVGEATPANARIMWYTPGYVALIAHRRGVPLRHPASPADLAAQLRATGADYLYLADVQPRDSLWSEGSPLAPASFARGLAHIEWARPDAEGRIQALLLKIDKETLASHPPP
jgi:hypothetical protein